MAEHDQVFFIVESLRRIEEKQTSQDKKIDTLTDKVAKIEYGPMLLWTSGLSALVAFFVNKLGGLFQ